MMGTVWCVLTIFFSVGFCHRIESETGLRYTYTVTIDASEKVTCRGVGYVDGESFVTYYLGNLYNPAKWLQEVNRRAETTYFTQRCKELESELRKMTNRSATAGIQTFHVNTECKSEKGTALAYDGNNIRSFSLNNTHAQGCPSRLTIYRRLMSKDIKPPQVNVERRLLHYSDNVRLKCLARDFYPAGLEMHWCRGDNDSLSDPAVERDPGPMPQGDGSYRKFVEIVVRLGEEHQYVCKVYGVATQSNMEFFKWEGSASGISDGTAFLLALFLPAIAAVIVVVFGFLWHRQGELRPARIGGRATPLADTTV